MSQLHLTKLACQACKRLNYWTRKNKKKVERKIEFSKFCSSCREHTAHREVKK